ncbi:MAG: histidinol dehydrogenase [Rickettsiales bacterium]|jgi:histidinol dehydrogenase|nr:histidinol dehydrogenase [Rickettsiales bacterium]
MQKIQFTNIAMIQTFMSRKSFDNAFDPELQNTVASIIKDVKTNGDAAIIKYTKKFDNADNSNIKFSPDEINESYDKTDPKVIKALEHAYNRVCNYHSKQLPSNHIYTDDSGTKLGWNWHPLDSAGLYVPGGLASYPSTVIMTAAVAKTAGVKRIISCFPTPNNDFNPAILAACKICGIDEIYRIGGAQAIAAMSYGSETIIPINKIFGPGNKYVAEAKRQVFGKVGIDMIAGPSEILVITDNKSNPEWIAMDLLSQAEHDPDASVYLICDDADFIDIIIQEAWNFIEKSPRKDIITKSFTNNAYCFEVNDIINEASDIANIIAPEHIEIATINPEQYLPKITNAGAIFLGQYTPEAIGDYIAGPSHVLPTSQTAKFSSGIGVSDFMRRSSIIECTKESFRQLAPDTELLARTENLAAHADSIKIRNEK